MDLGRARLLRGAPAAGAEGLGRGGDGEVAQAGQALRKEACVVARLGQPGEHPVVGGVAFADLEVDQQLAAEERSAPDEGAPAEGGGCAETGQANAACKDGVGKERIEAEDGGG